MANKKYIHKDCWNTQSKKTPVNIIVLNADQKQATVIIHNIILPCSIETHTNHQEKNPH